MEVTLENVGTLTSSEVVMLFSQDRVASITPSEDKLRAYKRVFVDAGATKQVQLNVSTSNWGLLDTTTSMSWNRVFLPFELQTNS